MELEIYLKYKMSTTAEIISKDGCELSSDDELCYYLDFWRKNKTNLKCTIKDDMNDYNWMNIIEPTVDEDTIDFSQLEIVTVGQSYDVFSNTVTCRVVLRLEPWWSAEFEDVLIHKNKLKWNILEWLNGMNGFITLRNEELRYLTEDKMIYGIPTSELRYDNLDVKFKLRTQEYGIELKLNVKYQPRIITNPVRYNSKMQNILTDAEKFTYDAEFWNTYRDKFYLESDTLLDSFMWYFDDIIEPVVDTNIINMELRELLSYDYHFDKNSYYVQFEVVVQFDLPENVDVDELCIHKNRLADLITDWLTDDAVYDSHAFISTGDEDSYADFGNVTVHYKVEVEREDVEVNVEVKKQEVGIIHGIKN